jgi:tetratricopeptide (TPR) repeat protein
MLGRPGALVLALASVLAAAPAMAQPKANRPPQDVANDLVKQAITKSQQGDHLGAIDLYLKAWSLLPQHTLLSNVGAEYQQAGKPIEALKYFCLYLEKDPTGTVATYAASKAKALQIELGNKDVDDASVCKPPPKKQPPKEQPPPPPPPGDDVTGTKDLPTTPPKVETSSGGSSGGGLKIAGVTVGVLGLAGVAVGGYYGMKAADREDLLNNHDPMMPWPDNIRELDAEGYKFRDRARALIIGGGAVTAIGAVLFIVGATRQSSPETEKISIQPTASASSVGISIGRGF